MKYSEAKLGRVFVLRLEDGEIIHQIVEKFARGKNIKSASVILLGGADKDSRIPEKCVKNVSFKLVSDDKCFLKISKS